MNVRKIVFLSMSSLVLVTGLYFLLNYGYLVVTVTGDEITKLEIISPSRETRELSGNNHRLFLKKGTYKVVVSNNSGEYLAQAAVGGFLSTKEVSALPEVEKKRVYALDEPLPCVYGVSGAYYSSPCGSHTRDLVYHSPATIKNPPLVKRLSTITEGYVEGYAVVNSKPYLVILEEGSANPQHRLYELLKGGRLEFVKNLDDLDPGAQYLIDQTDDGFTALGAESGILVTYDRDLNSSTSQYPATKNDMAIWKAIKLKDKVAVIYTNDAIKRGEFSDHAELELPSEELENAQEGVVVVLYVDGQEIEEITVGVIDKIAICGPLEICVSNNGEVRVLSVANDMKFTDSLTGVDDFAYFNKELYVSTEGRIVKHQLDKYGGPVIYKTPEDHLLCGVAFIGNQLHFCLETEQEQRSVLGLDLTKQNNDSVDRRVAGLRNHEGVSSVSVNNNFIHVTPSLGEPSFQEDIGELGYSVQEIEQARDLLRRAVKNSELEEFGYKINYGL